MPSLMARRVMGSGLFDPPAFYPYIPVQYGADLLTNGDFETWASATDAGTWTEGKGGTTTINREDSDFYAGAHACRFDIDASNSFAQMAQTVLTANEWYLVGVAAKCNPTGKQANVRGTTLSFFSPLLTTSYQLFSGANIADGTSLFLARAGTASGSSIYYDNASAKLITFLSTLGRTKNTPTGDVIISTSLSVPLNFQGGCFANIVSKATARANGVHVYIDRGSGSTTGLIRIVKYVGGTRTLLESTVMAGAIEYADEGILTLTKSGTTYTVTYRGAAVGTPQTIADAGIVDNTMHAQWATSPLCHFFTFSVADYEPVLGSFAWVSDVHSGSESWLAGELDAFGADVAGRSPDFLLATGDLIHNGLEAEQTAYDTAVAAIVTQYEINGNHETPLFPFNAQVSFVANGVKFICFSAAYVAIEGDPDPYMNTGQVSAETLTWIETELGTAGANHPVLVCHWPICSEFTYYIRDGYGRQEIYALCAAYGVRLFLSGHNHDANEIASENGMTHVSGAAAVPPSGSYNICAIHRTYMELTRYSSKTPFAQIGSVASVSL